MVGIDITQLGLDLGTGGVIGGVMGFAAKKIAKIIAVLVGLELAVFKFLESENILAVDWEKLSGGLLDAGNAATSNQPPDFLMSLLSTMSISGGFAAGFLAGFKLG